MGDQNLFISLKLMQKFLFLKFEIHHGVYVQYVFLVYHFHDYVFLLALSESKW
jgi:hypothetical protein